MKIKSDYFLNRELSWIEFNRRVLEEAMDRTQPLFERVKFLSIFCTNLDEFFMIRVSGLKRQIMSGVHETSSDGLTAREQHGLIYHELVPMIKELYRTFNEDIIRELAKNKIRFHAYEELSRQDRKEIDNYFDKELYPILTPIAIDKVHPFPNLVNRTLALAIVLDDPETAHNEERISVVQIPGNLPRFHKLDNPGYNSFLPIEDIIRANAHKLFPGMHIQGSYAFRITRNADLELEEDEADDLLTLIEEEIKRRRLGVIVRLEVQKYIPDKVLRFLLSDLELDDNEVYMVNGLINLGDLMNIYKLDKRNLKDESFSPRISSFFVEEKDFFKAIRKRDILLHHPFYAFSSVSEFIAQAAEDKNVFAIKLILYRTSGDSPIIKSLIQAAENGKQVTAVVELKARFDEENNIIWARKLENAGVHVVYGISGLKTHCKMLLIVRREHGEMKRYLHLSTGNYNPITSKIYTDFGLFTANEDFCKDASDLFNYLTGFSRQKDFRKFLVAPYGMRKGLIALIDNEIKSHKQNCNGRIIIKSNSLVDDKTIMKLYQASAAGIKIDLIIRGICRIRPGIIGQSENIRVISIVGRFLEHTRAYWFYNNGKPVIYTGSADIMQRNFDRRVEMLYPIEHSGIKQDITEILEHYLNDNVKARVLDWYGNYTKKRTVPKELSDSVNAGILKSDSERAGGTGCIDLHGLTEKTPDFNAQEFFVTKVKKKFLSERKKEYRKKINKLKQKNKI